jgi:hypothetical protein
MGALNINISEIGDGEELYGGTYNGRCPFLVHTDDILEDFGIKV